eukprot:jgi/Hompol1/5927/HPOL_002130-RA
MGRVVQNAEAYQHFVYLATQAFSEPYVMYLVERIEAFCAKYMVRWGECSFERTFALLSRPFVAQFTELDYITCMTNHKEIEELWSSAGQRYRGKDGLLAAVIKIQAIWRMHVLRVEHLDFVLKLRAGEKFREKWLIKRLIAKIQSSREERHLEHVETYHKLQSSLGQSWQALQSKKRVVIHLPSMGFGTTKCAKHDGMHTWQMRQIGRLMDLLDPLVSMVYITEQLSTDLEKFFKQAVGYTLDLMQLVKSKRGDALLVSKILKLTFKNAPTIQTGILKLLNVPIIGSFEGSTEYAHNRTKQRDMALKCGVPIPPGASHFKSATHFYETFEELMKTYPQYERWIFKMNSEMDGRDLDDAEEIVEKSFIDQMIDLGESHYSSQHPLKDKMYQCVHFHRKDLWSSWNVYLKAFIFHGGVIEAAAYSNKDEDDSSDHLRVEFPIVHLHILPDHTFTVFCSSSLSSQLLWCTAIKPYFTENLSQAYYCMFMSCCRSISSSGKMCFDLNSARKLNLRYMSKVQYVDMDHVRQVTHTEHIDTETDNEERVAIYTNRLDHQNFEVLPMRLFNGICIETGIIFDSKWKLGTQLPMIEEGGKTCFPMMCMQKTYENAIETILQNIVIIGRRMASQLQVYNNFMEISNLLSHILSRIRSPTYEHIQTVPFKNTSRLNELEKALNAHIALPLTRMLGYIVEEVVVKPKDEKSGKKTQMSTVTINLLSSGIPSKSLINFYADFGREKIETSDSTRKRNANRVPPGLPMDEYMAIMEHLAGIDQDEEEEEETQESSVLATNTAVTPSALGAASRTVAGGSPGVAKKAVKTPAVPAIKTSPPVDDNQASAVALPVTPVTPETPVTPAPPPAMPSRRGSTTLVARRNSRDALANVKSTPLAGLGTFSTRFSTPTATITNQSTVGTLPAIKLEDGSATPPSEPNSKRKNHGYVKL